VDVAALALIRERAKPLGVKITINAQLTEASGTAMSALAQSGHSVTAVRCLLLGEKRTLTNCGPSTPIYEHTT
jgi:hypothetical protein